MRAGQLRTRLEYKEPTSERNPTGELKTDYVTKLVVWGNIMPLEGSEPVQPYTKAKVTHKITVRYNGGILPKGILCLGERKFRIASVLNVEERNREMAIMASEYDG